MAEQEKKVVLQQDKEVATPGGNTLVKHKILVKGILLGDGSIMRESEVKKYLVAQEANPSAQLDKKSEETSPEEDWDMDGDKLMAPPYDPCDMSLLLEKNTEHFRCTKAKADDVTGLSYQIKPADGVDTDDKEFLEHKEVLEAFFKSACPGSSFIEMMNRCQFDYEGIGSGYMEVARDATGKPTHLYHVPGKTMRIKQQKMGYVQMIGQDKIHFQTYGTKYRLNDNGTYSRLIFIDCKTGKFLTGTGATILKKAANEMIQFVNYHPNSPFYGNSDVIPAMTALVGNLSAASYNITFFDNHAVPACSIVIKGADLSPELEAAIKEFFVTELKGKPHRSLVIPVPFDDVDVTITPLDVKVTDQSFTVYRKDNRDEILRAHGVHPARIGIIEKANLGSGSGLSQAENYKNSVVEPTQHKIEHKITSLILQGGFGFEDCVFKFQDLDLRDKEQESKIGVEQIKVGALSLNEFRRDVMGKEGIDGRF